jgi:hypothetical protein
MERFLRGKVQQLEAVVAREHSLWRREAFAGKIRACRLSICPNHAFLERTSSSAEAPKLDRFLRSCDVDRLEWGVAIAGGRGPEGYMP